MSIKAGDLIAGPILRRVESNLVTVWCALRVPATVTLNLYLGRGTQQQLTAVGRKPAQDTPQTRDLPSKSVRIGHELHVVVATFAPAASLQAGQAYSYDLELRETPSGSAATLTSLGLLGEGVLAADGTIKTSGAGHKHLPLGYAANVLPSFVMAPQDLAGLKVVHGSCRRPYAEGSDALVGLDTLIKEAISNPAKVRPHLLVLTGDQIYADEVEPEMLRALTRVGAELIAGRNAQGVGNPVTERLPVDLPALGGQPAATVEFPVEQSHFPAGRRQRLVVRSAKFSSGSAESHLLGLGEWCAMYCMAWSNVLWPNLQASLTERWPRVDEYRIAFLAQSNQYPSVVNGPGNPGEERSKEVKERLPFHQAWRLVPRPLRMIDTFQEQADRDKDWNDGERNHWKNFWPDEENRIAPFPEKASAAEESSLFGNPDPARRVRLRQLANLLTPAWYAGKEYYKVQVETRANHVNKDKVVADSERDRLHRLNDFYKGLPYVRRALANVPSVMMFDDHEITDDWNISKKWVDDITTNSLGVVTGVKGSSLGRAIIRNGLSAFALFQAWGNDPTAYANPDTRHGQLLADLGTLFNNADAARTPRSSLEPATATRLERRFRLQPEVAGVVPVTWHFKLKGPNFEFLGLDSRTRRGFSAEQSPLAPMTNEAPAALLDDDAFAEQIPPDFEPDVNPNGVCFVLAPAPFLGAVLLEHYGQPVFNVLDELGHLGEPKEWHHEAKVDFDAGRLDHDPEPWGFTPRLFERVLGRLSNRRRVVFLSGDVHYGTSAEMTYWKLPATADNFTRFIQLTSSALQNRQGIGNLHIMNMALVQQLGGALSDILERVAWNATPPGGQAPLAAGANPFNTRTQALLTFDPIVIAPRAIPEGAQQRRAPNWVWKMKALVDPRPENERSSGTAPTLPTTVDDDKMAQIAARHHWLTAIGLSRRIQWDSNVCEVTFVAPSPGSPAREVVHRLYGVQPGGGWLTHVLRVEHRAALTPPDEVLPAVPGTVNARPPAPPPSASSPTPGAPTPGAPTPTPGAPTPPGQSPPIITDPDPNPPQDM